MRGENIQKDLLKAGQFRKVILRGWLQNRWVWILKILDVDLMQPLKMLSKITFETIEEEGKESQP